MIQYLTARQIVNSGLLGLDIILLFFIIIGLLKGKMILDNRFIIATAIHLSGLAIVRGWTAILIAFLGHDDVLMTMEDQYPFDLIGATIALTGVLWLTKLLSPPEWGNHGWILSLAVLILFVSGTLVI